MYLQDTWDRMSGCSRKGIIPQETEGIPGGIVYHTFFHWTAGYKLTNNCTACKSELQSISKVSWVHRTNCMFVWIFALYIKSIHIYTETLQFHCIQTGLTFKSAMCAQNHSLKTLIVAQLCLCPQYLKHFFCLIIFFSLQQSYACNPMQVSHAWNAS